ncbi:Leucyl aminopeptidase yscIV, partial [Spiromyces aspiralis]
MFEIDPNSQANLDEVVTTHLHLSLAVDFKDGVLRGSVVHDLEAVSDNVTRVVFDTNHLVVSGAYVLEGDDAVSVPMDMSTTHPVFGVALAISLPTPLSKGDKVRIRVDYNTTSESGALQFLTPEYDSPAVKLTYSADITAPNPLRVLMSAINIGSESQGDHTVYKFLQKTTMPSYLLALVCGNLAKADISPRCAVWTEPENVDACAWEFAEMEKSLKTAEDLISPYSW